MERALMKEECRGIIHGKRRCDFFPPHSYRSTQVDPNPFPQLSRLLNQDSPPKERIREIKAATREQEQTSKKEPEQNRTRAGRVKTEIPEAARSLLCLITGNSAHQIPQQENLTSIPAQIPSLAWFLQEFPFDQH